MPAVARLLIECPDTHGLVAAAAGFIASHGGNLLESDHHTDPDLQRFFMRLEFETEGMTLDEARFRETFAPVAERYRMHWRLSWARPPRRMAILVSRETHCLADLLWRTSDRGNGREIEADLRLVIGNHDTARDLVQPFGVRFCHVPILDGDQSRHESDVLDLLESEGVELIVLARYMRVLSARFIAQYMSRIINIHHSFLPAFAGARPYHQAFARGVKLIGATSHYATEDLDQGPIIAQRTTTVSHRDRVHDLVRKGRDLERIVLADAVRLHLADKILVSGNKTIVFE